MWDYEPIHRIPLYGSYSWYPGIIDLYYDSMFEAQ